MMPITALLQTPDTRLEVIVRLSDTEAQDGPVGFVLVDPANGESLDLLVCDGSEGGCRTGVELVPGRNTQLTLVPTPEALARISRDLPTESPREFTLKMARVRNGDDASLGIVRLVKLDQQVAE